MGSPSKEKDHRNDEKQVNVQISNGFWMARTECTQEQWKSVMGSNPSRLTWSRDLPVDTVSWDAAQAFIVKLNELRPLKGWRWVLPTEAQWEYACRAGTQTAFAFGDTLPASQANFGGRRRTTDPVATHGVNAWGLYDMHGNVWEWCADWYAKKLPGGEDPVGPSIGTYRVVRGGCWGHQSADCRSACRSWSYGPDFHCDFLGFRVAVVSTER